MQDIGERTKELIKRAGLNKKLAIPSIVEIINGIYLNLNQMGTEYDFTKEEKRMIFEGVCKEISSSIQSGDYLIERLQKDERYRGIISN